MAGIRDFFKPLATDDDRAKEAARLKAEHKGRLQMDKEKKQKRLEAEAAAARPPRRLGRPPGARKQQQPEPLQLQPPPCTQPGAAEPAQQSTIVAAVPPLQAQDQLVAPGNHHAHSRCGGQVQGVEPQVRSVLQPVCCNLCMH